MVQTIDAKIREIIAARLPVVPYRQLDSRIILLCALALVALVFAAFGRTLTTFFIADDFGEVAYVARIANGRWDLFWSNWTGNFMQIPGMSVYRPFLLVSLLTDYLIWHANSVGFYLTNLLYYAGDVVLLFLCALELTKAFGRTRSLGIAFFSAALFAVNPLHCESVSWVVGRVDTTCCLFSLASVYCFLRSREHQSGRWLAACIATYLSGLLFKEMAIGVPILVTAIALFLPRTHESRFSLTTFLRETWPIWAATAIYFVVRFVVLGTLTGGYTGAIGDGQGATAFRRWLDIETYGRLLFPLAASLFPQHSPQSGLLKLLYCSLGTLVALRALRGELPWRYLLVNLAWLFSAAVPIYKLWGIGMDLEGARFCFFLTVPLSLLFPLLLFSPARMVTPAKDRSLQYLAAALLFTMVGLGYKTTLHSNANWVHAGKEVRDVLTSATQLAEQNPGKQIIVLGIPKRQAGAHMIYNGATFKTMLEPPFVKQSISDRFLTFDPIFYGPNQYINSRRFRDTVHRSDVAGAYLWNAASKSFVRLNSPNVDQIVAPLNLEINGTTLDVPNVDPWPYDYVDVVCRMPALKGADARMVLHWMDSEGSSPLNTAERVVPAGPGSNEYHALIPVSHYWRWFASGKIQAFKLDLPSTQNVRILSARLMSDRDIRPTVSATVLDDGSGVFAILPTDKFRADVRNVPNAAAIQIECSKPNYFFDQIEEKDQASAISSSKKVSATTFDAQLPEQFLPKNQYCELRVRALAADGKPVGEYSEPVIVYLK